MKDERGKEEEEEVGEPSDCDAMRCGTHTCELRGTAAEWTCYCVTLGSFSQAGGGARLADWRRATHIRQSVRSWLQAKILHVLFQT